MMYTVCQQEDLCLIALTTKQYLIPINKLKHFPNNKNTIVLYGRENKYFKCE